MEVLVDFIITILNIEFSSNVFLFVFALFVIALVKAITNNGKIAIGFTKNKVFWLTGLIGVMYATSKSVFRNLSLTSLISWYCLVPITFFCLGYYACEYTAKQDTNKRIRNIIMAVVVGCQIHCILNLLLNRGRLRWELQDYFSREIMSATNLAAVTTVILSLVFCIILETNKRIKLVGTFFVLIAISYVLLLGTRTQFAIAMLVFCIAFFIYIRNNTTITRRGFKRALMILVILSIILISYRNNIGGIRIVLNATNLFDRFTDSATTASDLYRWHLFLDGLRSMGKYPFGGNPYRGYFHNYFLDIARVSGIIPMILSIIVFSLFWKHIHVIFLNNKVDMLNKYMIVCVGLGLTMNFMVEPILDGYLGLYFRFCLIAGMIEHLICIDLREKRCKLL